MGPYYYGYLFCRGLRHNGVGTKNAANKRANKTRMKVYIIQTLTYCLDVPEGTPEEQVLEKFLSFTPEERNACFVDCYDRTLSPEYCVPKRPKP